MTPVVCTHWHPRTLLFYNLELIIYAAASGNYTITIRTHKNYSLQIHNCN